MISAGVALTPASDYEPIDFVTKRVDKDHIVPRSERASDSLDSLVITFSAINKWKGKRTAWQFVEQEQGKPVPGPAKPVHCEPHAIQTICRKLGNLQRPRR